VVENGESRPKTTVRGARTVVVRGVPNGIGTGSSTVVDSTCPVATDADVDDDYKTPQIA